MKEKGLVGYLKASVEELGKVTWPTKNQAVRLTIIVLIFCLIVTAILMGVDFVLSYLRSLIVN